MNAISFAVAEEVNVPGLVSSVVGIEPGGKWQCGEARWFITLGTNGCDRRVTVLLPAGALSLADAAKQFSAHEGVIHTNGAQQQGFYAREHVLVKVELSDTHLFAQLGVLLEPFSAKFVRCDNGLALIEATGDTEKVDALIARCTDYGAVVGIARNILSIPYPGDDSASEMPLQE